MRQSLLNIFLSALFLVFTPTALASAEGGGPVVQFINYYDLILSSLGLAHEDVATWGPILAGLVTLLITMIIGLRFKRYVETLGNSVAPSDRFSVSNVVEMVMDVVFGIGRDTIGHDYKPYLPVLAGIFVFILISNLMGLIPGFPPATESINTNLAIGLTAFLVYNYAGIKAHGASYIKQFLGPVIWLAPLMFFIEIVSHMARPFSLSLRLLGNLFGDHLMLGVFTGLTYVNF